MAVVELRRWFTHFVEPTAEEVCQALLDSDVERLEQILQDSRWHIFMVDMETMMLAAGEWLEYETVLDVEVPRAVAARMAQMSSRERIGFLFRELGPDDVEWTYDPTPVYAGSMRDLEREYGIADVEVN